MKPTLTHLTWTFEIYMDFSGDYYMTRNPSLTHLHFLSRTDIEKWNMVFERSLLLKLMDTKKTCLREDVWEERAWGLGFDSLPFISCRKSSLSFLCHTVCVTSWVFAVVSVLIESSLSLYLVFLRRGWQTHTHVLQKCFLFLEIK